jgi:hypothetical protein
LRGVEPGSDSERQGDDVVHLFGPRVKLCIWHAGRCGSQVLGDLLNQDSRIVWGGEVLEKYSKAVESAGESRKGDPVPGALRLLRKARRRGGRNIFGLEMKYWHLLRLGLTSEWMLDFLNREGYRYFIQERLNLLRLIVSGEVARQTGTRHLKVGDSRRAPAIRIEPDDMRERVREIEEFYEGIKRLLPDAPRITFEEDILPDPRIGYRKVMDMLALEPEEVTVAYRRTNPGKLADILTNAEEIAASLRDTEYAWMLDE